MAQASLSRDRALDALRGVAIVLMILSHVGAKTKITAFLHLPLWISAAEPFVMLSGVVLGMRVRAGVSARDAWRRARQFWLIHLLLMTGLLAVHELTGRFHVPWVRDVGLAKVLWMLPTLRLQSDDYMNILPLFIVFFAVAPLVLWAFRASMTALALGLSGGLWAVTQWLRSALRFSDPISGEEVFALGAWQLVFVLGLALGYHGERVRSMWQRGRGVLLPALLGAVAALFALAQLQRGIFAGNPLQLDQRSDWLFDKTHWGPVRAVYVTGLMLLAYGALRRLEVNERVTGAVRSVWEPLELLGKRSLYCFLVHLGPALLAVLVAFDTRPRVLQELGAVAAVVFVYVMARYRVFARVIPS